MGKYKKNPKYNVVSIRVTDEEKALLDEMIRRDRTNISSLMRVAVFMYACVMNIPIPHEEFCNSRVLDEYTLPCVLLSWSGERSPDFLTTN